MKLPDYLSTNNLSHSTFAAAIGVSRQALHRYTAGERRPEWDVLERIRTATNGAVTANDFMSSDQAPPVATAPEVAA